MENLSHSRHPNRSKKTCSNAAAAAGAKSLYDDVYGGPPKFSSMAAKTTSHLSPRMEDYSEIFGSFQASRTSSIPVLDLPAVDESEVFFDARRSSGFDYAEIFGGGFQGFDFAVSYKDLVNGNPSDEAWSEESDISGKNYSNGGSKPRLNGATEFSVTYHQARKMSSEDVTNNGVTHVAQLHSVPGYSFMVDSPSQLSGDRVTADNYLDMDFGTETAKPEQPRKAKSSSSNGGIGGNGNSFLDISEINLQTQPSDVPPPSRPPPAVGGKKADSDQPVSKSNSSLAFEGIAGDSSPNFFDVEVDASSSAAISAAAIKEAVEKAQARLKSAKELMEKKKGLQRSRKSGSKKFTEERAGETVLKDEAVKGGASERDGVGAELVGKEEKRKASKSASEVPEVFHGAELLSSHEKLEEEDKREKESWSSSGSYKIDESNEWKEATEFFEIVTTDELKKDFEQCEEIILQNLQNNGHEHEANGATEISQKHSEKVKAEDHEVEEFEEKKKVEVLGHKEEQSVNLEEESEMQDCGKTDGATRTEELLEPNERIAEADSRRTENTEPTLIACNNDESSEEIVPPQETLTCEKVETTASSEMDSGVAVRQNEFIDKNFTEPSIIGDDFTDEAQETLPSDFSVKKSCSEINAIPEVTEESGVFEIENLLVGEKLKAFGQLPEDLGATELSHLDNQDQKTEEIGSTTGEPNSEQVTSSSHKLPESEKQERDSTHGSKEREEDRTQPQVSLDKESATPTHAVKESTESKRKMEERQENQKPVQKVNSSQSTGIKEKTGEEREKEKQRLRKVDEAKEREKEREVQQTNQRKEKTSGEVANGEKQKNQKSAPPVETERKQSKTSERKEKTPREVESERKENERLRRIEEEREREREREKDRMAVDLATLERESRERAERVAVERVTAEARQRAMADARERLEKACAEAREKSLAGKTAESRVRAERAAVERATAEARERAAGRAMAERASFEAKDRVQRSVSDNFSASLGNSRLRQSSSSSDLQNLQSQNSGFSRFQNSSVYSERYEGVEGESAQRCKARLERHRRTTERAAKALAEKNMRDLLAQREQTERNRVAETLDADVRRWSSGKEGNLRALLSTLQYILGPDSGWQPIPLTEVITSAAVKKAYRKATLCVHPDKLQQRGANIHQKYLCEKVFDLLKEGWNKFNSEER